MNQGQPLAMVNGVLGGKLSPQDRGLNYGDGLFETMRLSDAHIPLLSHHLSRLVRSCSRLGIPLVAKALKIQLQEYLDYVTQQLEIRSGVIKIVVTRGIGGSGYYPPLPQRLSPTTIFNAVPLSHHDAPPLRLVPLSVRLARSPSLAGLKHLCRLEYVQAGQELVGCDKESTQGLLLDNDGWVIEAMHHNIFIRSGKQLTTPKLDFSGVEGVMRNLICQEIGPLCGYTIEERQVALHECERAEEMFLCNSVRGVIPVKQLQQRIWKQWPACDSLRSVIENLWAS